MENYNEYSVQDGFWFIDFGGSIKSHTSTEWFSSNGKHHRLNGPAIVERNYLGHVTREMFCISGMIHRIDGPADIEYDDNGNIIYETFCLLNGEVSKEDFYTPNFIDSYILEHS